MDRREDARRDRPRWPPAHRLALGGLALAILAGIVLAFTLDLGAWMEVDLSARIAALGVWGPIAVVVLMIVHCFVPFPAEILAFCAGAAFGALGGAALIWIGAMLGAALSFWLARRLGRPAVERFLPARHRAALDQWSVEQGTVGLLMARFVPLIAFNLINYAAGLTRVGWWPFLWTTGVGILPLTLAVSAMGAGMREIDQWEILAISAGGLGVVWLSWRLWRRRG